MDHTAAGSSTARAGSRPDLYPLLRSEQGKTLAVQALGPVLVASPHPDDESLGCGGLIARCARLNIPLSVLAMTFGEASHPGDAAWQRRLGQIRRREQQEALTALGLPRPDMISLTLPDGGMETLDSGKRTQVVERIGRVIASRKIRTVFVPAVDDCHGDHRETARIMADVVRRVSVAYFFSYQIWPPALREPRAISNETTFSHEISDLLALKRLAIGRYRSQSGGVDPDHAEGFEIPQILLDAKLKEQEVFALVSDVQAWAEAGKVDLESSLVP